MKKNYTTHSSKSIVKSVITAALPFALCLAGSPLFAENYERNRGHNWEDFGYSDSNYRDYNRGSDSRDRGNNRGSEYREYYEGSDRSYRQSDQNRSARSRDSRDYYDRTDNWSEGYGHPGYRDPDDYNYTRDFDRNYDSDYVYEYDAYDYDEERDRPYENERAHREWYGGYDDAGEEGILDW